MDSQIELYPHNQIAYDKLRDMLSQSDRACVIQRLPFLSCRCAEAFVLRDEGLALRRGKEGARAEERCPTLA